MKKVQPRLRMFAGPNGSGKSALKLYLPQKLLGVYLNADELESQIRQGNGLGLNALGVESSEQEVKAFFMSSTLLKKQCLTAQADLLRFADGRLEFGNVTMNSYWASVLVDFLRHKLLSQGISFTFETVMSHVSKVEFLQEARQAGYRTYLYYVATEDPAINISRVRNRVHLGGHDVPQDKIKERYYRSLELLKDAIAFSNRAYIFDNSVENEGSQHAWLAEITDGQKVEFKTDLMPAWFQAVLDKTSSPPDQSTPQTGTPAWPRGSG